VDTSSQLNELEDDESSVCALLSFQGPDERHDMPGQASSRHLIDLDRHFKATKLRPLAGADPGGATLISKTFNPMSLRFVLLAAVLALAAAQDQCGSWAQECVPISATPLLPTLAYVSSELELLGLSSGEYTSNRTIFSDAACGQPELVFTHSGRWAGLGPSATVAVGPTCRFMIRGVLKLKHADLFARTQTRGGFQDAVVLKTLLHYLCCACACQSHAARAERDQPHAATPLALAHPTVRQCHELSQPVLRLQRHMGAQHRALLERLPR
jgi:hypothetical protein